MRTHQKLDFFGQILNCIVKINYYFFQRLPSEFKDVKIDQKRLIPYLNKLKRKEFPKSPKTVAEVINAFKEIETQKLYGKYYVHTQNSVRIPDDQYGFTMLCDQSILKSIEAIPNPEILMDGTFEIVKRGPYQQLLIIYVAIENEVITSL